MCPGSTFEDAKLKELFSHLTLPLKERTALHVPKPKVIVISGPTAVGKTKHSLFIASILKGEIISADSMQVYKGMDIGTAKVSKQQQKEIPHYLIDVRSLEEGFNVVNFYEEATKKIREILARGHVPVVVGGTGFYIHALLYGPPQGPPSAPHLRQKFEEEMDLMGTEVLYQRLLALDPEYAKGITGSDRHKIVRALEIIALTNKKVSDFPKKRKEEAPYNFRCFFLYRPKETLYPHIEMRCDEMIAAGFIEEVRSLREQGLNKNFAASQAIGYRQCLKFLESGGLPQDFDAFVQAFKQASRRYAKRQFTWFRKEPLFRWLNVEDLSLEKSVEIILQDYELSF